MKNLSLAFHTLQFLIGCATILVSISPSKTLGLSYTNNTGFQVLDFDTPLDIQQFDSSLGTLNSVDLTFTADMIGNGGFENRSARVGTVTVNVSSLTDLTLNNQILFSLNPSQSFVYAVARYDGSTDYAGPSGRSFTGLTATSFNTQTLNNNLQAFIGSGNVTFLVSSISTSSVTGNVNLSSVITSYTQGTVQVTYNYDPNSTQAVPFNIPGESTFPVVGFLITFGLIRKTRKFIANK